MINDMSSELLVGKLVIGDARPAQSTMHVLSRESWEAQHQRENNVRLAALETQIAILAKSLSDVLKPLEELLERAARKSGLTPEKVQDINPKSEAFRRALAQHGKPGSPPNLTL